MMSETMTETTKRFSPRSERRRSRDGCRSRCKDCNHARGERQLGPIAKHHKTGTESRKKASCSCECHVRREVKP
jgi:hypothetical protein